MSLPPQLTVWLLQAAALQDTVIAKTMPADRTLFDYTSGTLQLIVLVLGVVVLIALVVVLLALKKAVDAVKGTIDKLYADTKPITTMASKVAGDAREVVAMLRTDAERLTHAAGQLSEQLLDVVHVTERRMDDVNAVLDVVQDELENTVISTTAALRGVRLGGRAIAGAMGPRKRSSRAQYPDDEPRYRENG